MWNSDHHIPDTYVFNNLLGGGYSQIAKASDALFSSDTLLLAHWDIGLISVLLKEN